MRKTLDISIKKDNNTYYVKLNYDLNVDSIYQDQPNGLGWQSLEYL
jgi:hypothetical protein